jgi:hypothetical protein
VAEECVRQIAEPVRTLRDQLGLVVDRLERHVATATGPAPYPWRSVQSLRQELGGAYLEATALARRIEELDRALAERATSWFDVAAAVDLGVRLAGHHVAAAPTEGPGTDVELLIDLGATPPGRGAPGIVALVVASWVAACARSARELPASTLTVRVCSDGPWALVIVADNGAGRAEAEALGRLAREAVADWGAAVDAAWAEGQGCAFELRLATRA